MPLFGNKSKTPAELVKALNDNLALLNTAKERDLKKVSEEVSKNLLAIKVTLYGTPETEPSPDQVNMLASEMNNSCALIEIITNLARIDFEGRKDAGTIFNNLLRRHIGTRCPTEEILHARPSALMGLVSGYENQDIALNCGMMLRECCRFESLVGVVLQYEAFYKFFDYVEVSTFDIASDAFSTFKEILTRHKVKAAEFLSENYDPFFTRYQVLLNSENYVTRRQALKLLGELLLDRHNFTVMNKYISSPENLKLMMNMLREKSRNIQFEAFHVFKIFVANPNKTKGVLEILLRNKEKLSSFLSKFHNDRTEDEQFNDEKSYLVKQIRELKPLEEEGVS